MFTIVNQRVLLSNILLLFASLTKPHTCLVYPPIVCAPKPHTGLVYYPIATMPKPHTSLVYPSIICLKPRTLQPRKFCFNQTVVAQRHVINRKVENPHTSTSKQARGVNETVFSSHRNAIIASNIKI